jgi:hypothetical protein
MCLATRFERTSVTKLALVCLMVVPVAGCFDVPEMMPITSVPRTLDGLTSGLSVPSACHIYTPDGRDIDTPERPFVSPVLFGCGVDNYNNNYGLVTGDVGSLAVLAGGRELGVFYAFDRSIWAYNLSVDSLLGRDGDVPQVLAWAAPVNIADPVDPVPELPGDDGVSRRLAITVVALGRGGVLLSLGTFDGQPLQVAVRLNWSRNLQLDDGSFGGIGDHTERFYVSLPPPIVHGLPPGKY